MKTTCELYNPMKEKIKPIQIRIDKDELLQIAINRYRKVDIHPVGRKMKRGR